MGGFNCFDGNKDVRYTWWKSGSWNAICDECGFKFKSEELKLRWDGLMVCPEDWEIRHPQELIRAIPDQSRLPWTRPEGREQDVPTVCTPIGRQGLAGYGTAGCSIVGLDLGYRGLIDTTHNA